MTAMIKMKAVQSRSAGSSPTGRALARGDAYSVSAAQAHMDEMRGFGARVEKATDKPAPAPARDKRD